MTLVDPMPIKAILPYFGAKRTLAPEIVQQLGTHRVYWEPFCGSMAVLLAKPSCVMETVNDLFGDLVNIARVVQDRVLGPSLYRRLRRVIFSEGLFLGCREDINNNPCPDLPDEDRAFAFFVCSWMGRNGVAGTRSYNLNFCVRYTANGGHAAKRWHSAVNSIPAWRRRLANVTILKRDALSLIDRIEDKKGTAIYCDPPYLIKGAKYVHDFDGQADGLLPDDHAHLASLLGRIKHSRVVVSYYEHPRLADLYPPDRWTYIRHDVSKAMSAQGKRGNNDTRATEVLIVNGPEVKA